MDVTAGKTVAFAHALLRCGTPQELSEDPETRLRLTLGLRKDDGRWTVAHEHHSFADTSDPMVHQHVSFPLDPETGAARTDIRPAASP